MIPRPFDLCCMISLTLWLAVAGWADPPNTADEFTMISGDYRVLVVKGPAYTYRSFTYKDKPVLIPTGWSQPVLNQKIKANGRDNFVGTGHGLEDVHSLEMSVDGVAIPFSKEQTNFGGPSAKSVRLVKASHIGPYAHRSEIGLTPEGFDQRYFFEVTGDTAQVNWLYPFMLIFPNEMDTWRVHLEGDKTVEGILPGTKQNASYLSVDRLTDLAMWNRPLGLAAVFVFEKPYPTRNKRGNFFIDRDLDNKFYQQVEMPLKIGERCEYRMKAACVESDASMWVLSAGDLIGSVRARFQK